MPGKRIRFAFFVVLFTAYGVFQSQRNAQSFDATFSVLLAALIVGWLGVSQALLGFIDRHNRTNRIYGAAGFFALLATILGVEWLAFRLKIEFGLSSGASTSFLSDAGWLVLFPVVAYYRWGRKVTA